MGSVLLTPLLALPRRLRHTAGASLNEQAALFAAPISRDAFAERKQHDRWAHSAALDALPASPHSVILSSYTAGAGGGLVASVATCPLDVIKTKLQAQRAVHGHHTYLGVVGKGFSTRGAPLYLV